MRLWPWRPRGFRPETGLEPDALTCRECLEVLYEFLDEELDSAERPRVQAHVDNCAECFQRLKFEERFLEQLRAAAAHGVPNDSLRIRLLEVLQQEAP